MVFQIDVYRGDFHDPAHPSIAEIKQANVLQAREYLGITFPYGIKASGSEMSWASKRSTFSLDGPEECEVSFLRAHTWSLKVSRLSYGFVNFLADGFPDAISSLVF